MNLIFPFQVVNEPADVHLPVAEMSTQFKLSCLSWNKYTKNHLASSDYEGIVTVWDMATRQVFQRSISVPISDIKCYVYYSGWFKIFFFQWVLTSWFCVLKIWNIQSVIEYEEHEKRAWSVDFSCTEPSMLVSGGDDCKVKKLRLW